MSKLWDCSNKLLLFKMEEPKFPSFALPARTYANSPIEYPGAQRHTGWRYLP